MCNTSQGVSQVGMVQTSSKHALRQGSNSSGEVDIPAAQKGRDVIMDVEHLNFDEAEQRNVGLFLVSNLKQR